MEMTDRYSRTIKLVGEEGLARLRNASVLIIGVGGVGSYAAEAVARSGAGHVTLMDGDTVQPSNLNRQLVALTSTLGRNKAEVMAERIKDIDPSTEVSVLARFYKEGDELDLTAYDWVIDAIDDVNAKTATIAAEVGTTPAGWNASIYGLIKNLSDSAKLCPNLKATKASKNVRHCKAKCRLPK